MSKRGASAIVWLDSWQIIYSWDLDWNQTVTVINPQETNKESTNFIGKGIKGSNTYFFFVNNSELTIKVYMHVLQNLHTILDVGCNTCN